MKLKRIIITAVMVFFTTTGAMAAAKTVYIPTEFTTLALDWDMSRSYESANFVVFWGSIVGTDPANYADATLRFNPETICATLETVYSKFITEIGFCSDDPAKNLGMYKCIIMMNDTWSSPNGPTGWAFGGTYDNTIGAMWVHPQSTGDGNVISHEFAHSLQGMIHIQENPAGGYVYWEPAGFFWECHANFMRTQMYSAAAFAYDMPRWLMTSMFHFSSTRHHYDSFRPLFVMQEQYGINMVNRLWKESVANEHPLITFRRLMGWNQGQLNDYMYGYAKREVNSDYPVNGYGTIIKNEMTRLKNNEPHYLWRLYAMLDRVAGFSDRYMVPDAYAPQDYGYNMVPLYPENTSLPVCVKFKGHTETNSYAGWRYGIVSLTTGGTARYGPVYGSNESEFAFQPLGDENAWYLVVMGAPVTHTSYVWEPGWPKIKRYPFEIRLSNAVPEGWQANFRSEIKAKYPGHVHPNGGGWTANTATVADTVYVGPRAVVLGYSNISGAVSISGTAWVDNAAVSGNVVIDGNARVRGGTISDYAHISDNAVLYSCGVSDNVAVKHNAFAWGGTFTGASVVGGDSELGSATVDGVYLQCPHPNNGRTENDGKGASDISNIDVNAVVTPYADLLMQFTGGCAVLTPTPTPSRISTASATASTVNTFTVTLTRTATRTMTITPTNTTAPAGTPVFANGADTGWLSEMEASGKKFYSDAGAEQDCLQILKDHCVNSIRLRVWVNPSGGWCGKADVINMAVRAKNMGFRIMIDFHYSDSWADPGQQTKPAAWVSYNFTQLRQAVYDHTVDVLGGLNAAGVAPEWVQVGNETNNGMLWEDGRASVNMANFAQLTASGYDAVKSVFPQAKVIVHISNGWDNALFRWIFDGLMNNGGKWDVIGMSLYPDAGTWAATAAQCLTNMNDMTARYPGKEIMISEIGMPWDQAQETHDFITDIITKVKSLPGGRGLGVFYWEPECYNWAGYTKGAFDSTGKPTIAMDAFLENCAAPAPTRTATATRTRTVSMTPSRTATRTATSSVTRSATASVSPTVTSIMTRTASASPSITFTITRTNTSAISPTLTVTRTYTRTATCTNTPLISPTFTVTRTYTRTATASLSSTPTLTSNLSPSFTATRSATASVSPTTIITNTPTSSVQPTSSVSPGATASVSPINSYTGTPANTYTRTRTPSPEISFTATVTATLTPTSNPSPIPTPTVTATNMLSGKFEITNLLTYPNPFKQGEGDLYLSFDVTVLAQNCALRVYTASFRKVLHEPVEGVYYGRANIRIDGWKAGKLSAGIYYAVIEGESLDGEKARSKPAEIIILK